jgi:acyl carrier protein
MTTDAIQTAITDAVARIAGISPPAPEADIYLAGFASTDALELLVEIEEVFGIVVPDDQFIECRTVTSLTRLVQDASRAVS